VNCWKPKSKDKVISSQALGNYYVLSSLRKVQRLSVKTEYAASAVEVRDTLEG